MNRRDPLAPLRRRFDLPEGIIYLDGNSLGPLPRAVPQRLRQVAEQLTGRSVFMLVNTHWHGDHTYGNQVFADVSIVATESTSARCRTRLEPTPAAGGVGRSGSLLQEYRHPAECRRANDRPG